MEFAIKNRAIEKYFSFLIRLDTKSKKKLITKLSESIEMEDSKKFDLSILHGAWADARSSDEIIEEIKNSRVEKNNSIEM